MSGVVLWRERFIFLFEMCFNTETEMRIHHKILIYALISLLFYLRPSIISELKAFEIDGMFETDKYLLV